MYAFEDYQSYLVVRNYLLRRSIKFKECKRQKLCTRFLQLYLNCHCHGSSILITKGAQNIQLALIEGKPSENYRREINDIIFVAVIGL